MTPHVADIVAVGLAFASGAGVMAWLTGEQDCPHCDRLQASNDSLLHQLSLWITRAQKAEARIEELWMEHTEQDAFVREYDAWKKGLDPRIAAMSHEQLERLLDDIFAPVHPSPASFATLDELIPRTVEGE